MLMNSETQALRDELHSVKGEIASLQHALYSGHGTRDDEEDLKSLVKEANELERKLRDLARARNR